MKLAFAFTVLTLTLASCKSTPEPALDAPPQTQRDERLVYDLLDPHDHAFRVTYELAATTAGATVYFTPVRGDTFVSEVTATDVHTGKRLDVALVSGDDARAKGHPAAEAGGSYFAIALDRPVPEGGEVRLHVEAKYEDRESYAFFRDELRFARLLATQDVTVVLPKDRELLDCNQPCTIAKRDDGRVVLRYVKRGRAPVPLAIRAREIAATTSAESSAPDPVLELSSSVPASEGSPPQDARASRTPSNVRLLAGEALGIPGAKGSGANVTCELLDPARRLVAWEATTELTSDRGDEATASIPGRVLDVEVRDLDTGAPVANTTIDPRPLGVGRDYDVVRWSPTDSARVALRARVESNAVFVDGDRLLFSPDRRYVRTIVVPAGWNVVGSDAPISVHTLADGRKELEVGLATGLSSIVGCALRCERIATARAHD